MEGCARAYFDQIEERGGVLPAIEQGFFQREIAEASYRFERALNDKRRVIVGVNDYVNDEEDEIEVLKITQEMEEAQKARLAEGRRGPDSTPVTLALSDLEPAARRPRDNLIPPILEAGDAYATDGGSGDTL